MDILPFLPLDPLSEVRTTVINFERTDIALILEDWCVGAVDTEAGAHFEGLAEGRVLTARLFNRKTGETFRSSPWVASGSRPAGTSAPEVDRRTAE